MTIRARMLMYGKEASNRKQEIDRQHHTFRTQEKPKCKRQAPWKCVQLAIPSWKSPFTEHGKAKGQLSHILQTGFPTTP